MTHARLPEYLAQIARAARFCVDFVADMDRAAFDADQRTQFAVAMNIVIMGETAAKIMAAFPDFVAAHPDVPWLRIRGMRNRVAHGYEDLDFDLMWETLQVDLPHLLEGWPPAIPQ